MGGEGAAPSPLDAPPSQAILASGNESSLLLLNRTVGLLGLPMSRSIEPMRGYKNLFSPSSNMQTKLKVCMLPLTVSKYL
jgi:hypothetical protein